VKNLLALRDAGRGRRCEASRRLAILVEPRDFRDKSRAQFACFRVIAALEISHARRETIPGALDRGHDVAVIDFSGGEAGAQNMLGFET
jgi:hypothetical protein